MAKELPYFKFYINDWLTGNVTLLDMSLQGVFINVCVLFWSRDCDLKYKDCVERFKKRDRKFIETLIKLEIIKKENEKIRINFLENQLEIREKISKTNKKNGEIGLNTQKKMASAKSIVGNKEEIRGEEMIIRGEERIIRGEERKEEVYERVFFKPSEIEKLKMDFKDDYNEAISILSNYKCSKNVTYDSDYHAMYGWVKNRLRENKEKNIKNVTGNNSSNKASINELNQLTGTILQNIELNEDIGGAR